MPYKDPAKRREQRRRWIADHPEYPRSAYRKNRTRILASHAAQRQAMQKIKLLHGCADCGYREHPVALQFDHIDGAKEFSVGSRTNRAYAALIAEISKCEVVCANCHFVRTAQRRGKVKAA